MCTLFYLFIYYIYVCLQNVIFLANFFYLYKPMTFPPSLHVYTSSENSYNITNLPRIRMIIVICLPQHVMSSQKNDSRKIYFYILLFFFLKYKYMYYIFKCNHVDQVHILKQKIWAIANREPFQNGTWKNIEETPNTSHTGACVCMCD